MLIVGRPRLWDRFQPRSNARLRARITVAYAGSTTAVATRSARAAAEVAEPSRTEMTFESRTGAMIPVWPAGGLTGYTMHMLDAAAPLTPRTTPVHINLKRDEKLEIAWADGSRSVFSIGLLRSQCPCAQCKTIRQEKDVEKTAAANLARQPHVDTFSFVGRPDRQLRPADRLVGQPRQRDLLVPVPARDRAAGVTQFAVEVLVFDPSG